MFSINRFQKLASIREQSSEEETVVSDRKKIFVLVGPPSVGKSTWVANTFEQPPYVIDRDSIVEQVAASRGWTYDDMFVTPPPDAQIGEFDKKYGQVREAPPWMGWTKTAFSKVVQANGEVQSRFTEKVDGATASNNDIVVDMTNMTPAARKQALKAVKGHDFDKIAVVFEFEGAEDFIKKVALKRAEAAKRMGKSKTISPAVFDRMFGSFSRPQPGEGFDQIVSVDNRNLLKQLANDSTTEEKTKMESTRWQRLAGLLKENVEPGDENEEHPHKTFRPGRDEEDEKDFLPNTFDWMRDLESNRELDEQMKTDMSPESMEPSREDEEEWLGKERFETDEYIFPERLPPGHEDYGFNAVVINDIGEELQKVERDLLGLRKSEILYKRLGRAIDALKDELRGKIGESIGTNDSVDGPYTEKSKNQPMEEANDIVVEWD